MRWQPPADSLTVQKSRSQRHGTSLTGLQLGGKRPKIRTGSAFCRPARFSMIHRATFFNTLQELDAFLSQPALQAEVLQARSVLAQVFLSPCDDAWAQTISQRVGALGGQVVVVGATTFGEICAGQARADGNVVSLMLFSSATLRAGHGHCNAGTEADAATHIIGSLATRPDEPLKGLLLLATTSTIDCSRLLQELNRQSPGLPLFGGGAADSFNHGRTLVLHGGKTLDTGWVAVGLYGHELAVLRRTYLGWAPLGKRMRATKVTHFTIETIDDRPAFDAYRHYLGIDADEHFFLNAMEFPLLVHRGDHTLARVPDKVHANGAIGFIADIQEGEELQFGYAHVDSIVARSEETEAAVRAFAPEAIALYSCGCRHFVMQQDVQLELQPFEKIAPTAGFFTYGEFCDLGDQSPLLNSTLVVVALRESEPKLQRDREAHAKVPFDIYAHSHARILSRFQHFARAITEDLETANRELSAMAEKDGLTGLANRRKLEALMDHELARSARHGESFSVVMCDIDHFKRFNDDFGHLVGDQVLRTIATTMQAHARATDVVCRYGGEELLILMPQTEADDALVAVERLQSAVAALPQQGEQALPRAVTLSYGLACFPGHGHSKPALLAAADAALYDAKRSGRNRVCVAKSVKATDRNGDPPQRPL
jgi:diguanylate cyclase (GGDEF)-like protein